MALIGEGTRVPCVSSSPLNENGAKRSVVCGEGVRPEYKFTSVTSVGKCKDTITQQSVPRQRWEYVSGLGIWRIEHILWTNPSVQTPVSRLSCLVGSDGLS